MQSQLAAVQSQLASVQSQLASSNVDLASVKRELAGKEHAMGEAAAREQAAREVLLAQVMRPAFCPHDCHLFFSRGSTFFFSFSNDSHSVFVVLDFCSPAARNLSCAWLHFANADGVFNQPYSEVNTVMFDSGYVSLEHFPPSYPPR